MFLFLFIVLPIQPLPIEECFKECAVFMLQEALEFSCGFVDKHLSHPEFFPPGMTRDCAVAVVLYTFGEYCFVLSFFFFFFFFLKITKQRKLHGQTKEHLQESEQLFVLASS